MMQCLHQSARLAVMSTFSASLLVGQLVLPAAAQLTGSAAAEATTEAVVDIDNSEMTAVRKDSTATATSVENVPLSKNSVLVETRLVLSIRAREVSLYRGDRLVTSYPVAVGSSETPTPQGQFTVSHMVVDPVWQSPWTGEVHAPGANSALGLRWIGFTSNDEGAFGFHGTPTVDSIGQAVSNGCVRMYNEDVVKLFEQVRVGTPVLVTY